MPSRMHVEKAKLTSEGLRSDVHSLAASRAVVKIESMVKRFCGLLLLLLLVWGGEIALVAVDKGSHSSRYQISPCRGEAGLGYVTRTECDVFCERQGSTGHGGTRAVS